MGRPLGRKNFGPLSGTAKSTVDGVVQPDSGDGRDQRGVNTTSASTDRQKGYNIPVYKARVSDTADMDVQSAGAENLYILAQKGARRFKVYSAANGVGVCKLVNDDGSSGIDGGEMVLRGFVGTDGGESVFISKISGRKAYDFATPPNAYTWYVEDDSAENVIILTAI
jgi:hypothetical protein